MVSRDDSGGCHDTGLTSSLYVTDVITVALERPGRLVHCRPVNKQWSIMALHVAYLFSLITNTIHYKQMCLSPKTDTICRPPSGCTTFSRTFSWLYPPFNSKKPTKSISDFNSDPYTNPILTGCQHEWGHVHLLNSYGHYDVCILSPEY